MKENCVLIEPSADLKEDFLAMAEEYRRAGDERYKSALENFSDYLARLAQAARGENLAPNRVPENFYWLICGGEIVGQTKLRHRLNAELEREGGHIGYDIRPSARKNGCGTKILELTLEKARDLGLTEVLLTCDTDNIASARIIEKNGGRLSEKAVSHKSGKLISRYWIEL